MAKLRLIDFIEEEGEFYLRKEKRKNTTNNKVYRHLLIDETSCGYCGLGKGCNLKYRREEFYLDLRNKKTKGSYPSWKLISKYRKQYKKPKLKFVELKHLKDYYEIKWD